ncbi:MAG: glycerol-3-phosphate 1-O-acyltransferase PlsB [Xanthomonadales bacterium]|nr:glycerol-3-phosphate 1-O-acyltransferase PlsB [Gammaproteobacteria bacterium]MBT8054228.1 glycerol-3-phosphate 1-O-acyltransferase PlsB [Gammaproteobacteria bacterium]NND57579.1 glycerol-3-phosphate 1-O-acyltransferase PlsB [Xanthomonadales bacterium]NNK51303.1 glycerol-3-phosphate 1-O-acyltransferase PlsB [Xanthomonadales bacterium]
MSTESPDIGFFARLKLQWFLFLRATIGLWVKANVLPRPFSDLQIDLEKPVYYIIDSYALSSLLILDRSCEENNLPRPLWPMELQSGDEPRSYLALRRKKGLIIRRTEVRSHSETLKRLVEKVCDGQEEDINLVPVTVLIGRAPDKETGLAKIFFTESWDIGGRIWRFINSLVNGRHTMVQFSNPISLRELADEGRGAPRSLRKVSRILRVHFQRVRSAAIGPDLSHRRTVVEAVLRSPEVRAAIAEQARKEKISVQKAERQGRSFAFEIAANYSYAFVRVASFALTWFWNRIYDGVELQHFRKFQQLAPNYEIIYVPCHRSHIDYLLFSYFVYHNGLVPPHIAAGVNLNLPIVGRFLRKGGAFFLRRSFRSQKLYSAVFHEYLARILSNGTSIEYFVEGTRSRTGRLLQPKGGMLAMTVRSYIRSPVRPVMFQPIYVGYEKLVEGNSYTAELSGRKKKSESLGDLFKVFGVLKKRYGKVHVSFAEPVLLDELLDRTEPQWRENTAGSDDRPTWLNPLVDELGQEIMTGINEAAHVNTVNLLAVILLTTRKLAMGRAELLDQLELYLDLLSRCRYSERITYTEKSATKIVSYGIELGIIENREHPLGDIVAIVPAQSILLTYFRNNVSHLVAVPSLIASCFLNRSAIEPELLQRIALALFPFLKNELFLPWDEAGFIQAIDDHIEWLVQHELLTKSEKDGVLRRPHGGSLKEQQLRVMGHALLQTFERYYITVAILARNGSGTMTRGELERLCFLTAQRMSQLNEFAAPEFSDQHLFRQFIALLREAGILRTNEEEKLEFNEMIQQLSNDAKYILSREIRHGILRAAQQAIKHPDQE